MDGRCMEKLWMPEKLLNKPYTVYAGKTLDTGDLGHWRKIEMLCWRNFDAGEMLETLWMLLWMHDVDSGETLDAAWRNFGRLLWTLGNGEVSKLWTLWTTLDAGEGCLRNCGGCWRRMVEELYWRNFGHC